MALRRLATLAALTLVAWTGRSAAQGPAPLPLSPLTERRRDACRLDTARGAPDRSSGPLHLQSNTPREDTLHSDEGVVLAAGGRHCDRVVTFPPSVDVELAGLRRRSRSLKRSCSSARSSRLAAAHATGPVTVPFRAFRVTRPATTASVSPRGPSTLRGPSTWSGNQHHSGPRNDLRSFGRSASAPVLPATTFTEAPAAPTVSGRGARPEHR